MKNHGLILIILIFLIILPSCKKTDPNKTIDEGNISENVYTSQEIGWTIEIPKGWKIISKEEKDKWQKKGEKAITEFTGEEMQYEGLKDLVGFKKNQFNIFQATSEPFEVEYEGEWEENNQILKELLYQTFESQGIRVDSTETSTETIDNIDFKTFSFTIYGPKGDIILKQITYSTLINGLDFGVNMSYNNDKNRDEMLKVWRGSKFNKK